MSLLFAIVGFLCGAGIEGAGGAIFGGVVGFTLGQVIKLSSETQAIKKDLEKLRAALAKEQGGRAAGQPVESIREKEDGVSSSTAKPESLQQYPVDESTALHSHVEDSAVTAPGLTQDEQHRQKPDVPLSQPISHYLTLEKFIAWIKGYFTEGNLFVRIGVLVLFLGIGFLLKYAAEHSIFPIELRLAGVAIGGVGLLAAGWWLRNKRSSYALILQGGGVGILYLVVFASFYLFALIPVSAGFALLVLICLLSSLLAVLQNAYSIAVMGIVGGFLAPILASTGSGNHIALFSYYAMLNTAILAIAWFKSWRILNLVGFYFTYIISTLWGVTQYRADQFLSTEPFLILFFVFYTAISVLFAFRQPPRLKGIVDTTLVFGNPLVAFGLQVVLVNRLEYGVALSAFAVGVFYLVLAKILWRHAKQGLNTLSEAFLALAVVFGSICIPFAVDGQWTAAAWALEGAGILWIGVRQDRLSARLFAVLLQLGAGIVFVAKGMHATGNWLFLNSAYLGSVMLAFSGSLSAYFLNQSFPGRRSWEVALSPILLVWGLVWWLIGAFYQFQAHLDQDYINTAMLLYATMVCICFGYLATRFQWPHARYSGLGLLPFMIVIAGLILAVPSHPSAFAGYIAWPTAFISYFWLLWRCDKEGPNFAFLSQLHLVNSLLLITLLSWEGRWFVQDWLPRQGAWVVAFWSVIPILTLVLLIKGHFWPLTKHCKTYLHQLGGVLAVYLFIWSLIAAFSNADATPLPYMPFLNPVDVMQALGLIFVVRWWLTFRNLQSISIDINRYVWISIVAICFIWINAVLLRTLHHWAHIPHQAEAMFRSFLAQASISILWTIMGMAVMVFAAGRSWRRLWFVGSALLGIVVLKLFLIDLAASGTIERIVSFLVVGALLVLIGYFSPLPPRTAQSE